MIIDEIQLYSAAEWGVSAELFASFSLNQVAQDESYILESVTGLDPDQISPVYYGGYSSLGATDRYYSMTLPPRDIALRIKLNPQLALNQTYSSLREKLYKVISKSRSSKVELRLRNNNSTIAVIQGFVQRFESSLFDSDPRVQLSIFCPTPMFKSPTYINAIPALTGPVYPDYYNRSYEDTLSTAPHGFKMILHLATYHVTSLKINMMVDGGYDNQPFLVEKSFEPGDYVYFSSEEDDKYLYFVRGSTVTHLTDKIASGSVWPIMFPGNNTYRFWAPTYEEIGGYVPGFTEFKFKAHYWGV